ncbi:hypothetical protein CEY16_12280 [Halalkalibacillus sediminis]|uniref:DUF5316 domain-containing protein n=1 Tax=Halalkalibacillus sediminis TaxID=2018042 RepID=A0A2I0QT46_9BACI|nr:DUF5316 family protein [Halalkalibacillus sediminis]PKR77496.1 hypothetical protein CEY16_12280 [Halalkalibacillus sediminis]
MNLKLIIVGLLNTLCAVIYGFVTSDWDMVLKVIGVSALLPLLVAGLLSGAFVSGDRNRANYHSENKMDNDDKRKWIIGLVLLSAPNAAFLLVLIIIGLITY